MSPLALDLDLAVAIRGSDEESKILNETGSPGKSEDGVEVLDAENLVGMMRV